MKQVPRFVYRYSGLGEIDSKSSAFLNRAYFVYKIWMLIAMYIFAITLFLDIYVNRDNLPICTDDGCIFAGIFVVIYKAMNLQFCQKRITRLLDEVLKCTDDLCEFSEVEYIKEIIEKHQVQSKMIFYGFTALGSILGTALLFFSPMEDGLLIRAQYPFNTTISPWHEISLVIETCAVFGGLLGIIGMDSFVVMICTLLTVLFDMLNVNFENCGIETKEHTVEVYDERIHANIRLNRKKLNNRFLYRYKTCFQFYQRLVCMTNDYNKLFSLSMFIQMLSSTSIICLSGFQAVVVGGQSSDVMKFGIYLSAAISQLLYICWIGNELNYASWTLDRSQWLSGWHNERLPNIVKMITLSTMFTRRSITLKASVFYVLSLETFIAIIRRSYSVYTLLNNMQATDQ
ncbi:odorant receptor 10-like [Bombus fervidus]|uniref:odorant receptor 10-like n=1 Tax=Bombus fervidus TaxID=203811 RepID=UPI003AB44423